jgi:hypothetical protein
MSNIAKKTVKITESALVDLIDNIVTEAVGKQKVQWIAEQEAKKTSLLESKIAKLEKTISEISRSIK